MAKDCIKAKVKGIGVGGEILKKLRGIIDGSMAECLWGYSCTEIRMTGESAMVAATSNPKTNTLKSIY